MMRTLLLALLPIAALWVGDNLMQRASGRHQVEASPVKPLGMRLSGYDAAEAADYWRALQARGGLTAERKYLSLDLAFPLFYGGALFALWIYGLAHCRCRMSIAIPLVLVLMVVVADWAENFIQLQQSGQMLSYPSQALDGFLIALASRATQVKLVLGALTYVGAVLVMTLQIMQ